ncbi:hypothetical protein ACHAWO_008820 [Cyclotella atomus]|uniref:Hexosyltransferase n=1 Tax=Cyclotella atomus TaxID=382360 RepID=A0ABD3QKX3_9STRA
MAAPQPKIMTSRTLILLTAYATVMTISCSYYFVQSVSRELNERRSSVDYYEEQFLPKRVGGDDVVDYGRSERNITQSSTSTFPLASHIVTHGRPRTATTLLFNMVAASYFLHLTHTDPSRIPSIHLQLWKREDAADKVLKREHERTLLLKTHIDLPHFKADNTVIFTAAMDKAEAAETKQQLQKDGYNIAFVQDMESLKQDGIPGLVSQYVSGYQLSSQDQKHLIEYFTSWEIIRQCCGQQMSSKWRNDMMPEQYKRKDLPHHPTCANYDIDEVEQSLMASELYKMMDRYPNLQALNKPSLNDETLNGTYCSSYNHRVKTEGLSFFGTPGGRPVRSGLDWAIKNEYNIGTETLTPAGVKMMEGIGMRELWRREDVEKKVWLKKLLRERTVKGAKSYKLGLEEIDDSLEFHFGDEENSVEEDEQVEESQAAIEIPVIRNPDLQPIASQNFDKSHAIFLISFGTEAAASTLVERCVLSLRRRGRYSGYIVVLTDAPPDRYEHVWDENVIVMHPQKEHMLDEDGEPLHYSKDNMSLKPKRFKTFVLDYVDMDSRLDDVELVYYLDIDILAGDSLDGLFQGLEKQYQVKGYRPKEDVSKLYFVTPLSKEWPLQSGTMIAERGTSQHCLRLWREEIDAMLKTGRGRDQDALRNIYIRMESGDEKKCQLVRMDNENYISFPTPRNFAKLSASGAQHANLIHISNSLFAKKIEEEEQNHYIHQILQLSEEEVASGIYGKAVVRAKDTSR